ncbi:MAG: tripartite tricarboxylate transporter substrate binding protein [Aquisalimonadaceae bacterium]
MKKVILASMVCGTLLMGAGAGQPANADFPERRIEFIVAWNAGGATDLITRAVTPKLAEILGVDVSVRNIAGAAGTIGTAQFTRANPDGYTLLQTPAGPVIMQPHLRDTGYGLEDMEPICRLSLAPLALMVPQESPYKSVDDLVDAAKASPGGIDYGSAGAGTLPHVSMIGLSQVADVEMTHVPYQGSAPAMRALLGGEVDAVSEQSNLVPRYELRALGLWSEERTSEMPDVPTMKEQGYDLTFANWNAWYAPPGTPKDVVNKLADACEKALQDPAVIKAIQEDQETPIQFLGPEDLREFHRTQFEVAEELLRASGLTD